MIGTPEYLEQFIFLIRLFLIVLYLGSLKRLPKATGFVPYLDDHK